MANLPIARSGDPLSNPPTGFPLFFDKRKPRVVTADPWAFLCHLAAERLTGEQRRRAFAYVEQAFDFCEAAHAPHVRSKPLLYYYSFLNLVKAALVLRRIAIPPAPKHGISDPRANAKVRLNITGQRVDAAPRSHSHSEIFPELLAELGYAPRKQSYRILDLFRQIPNLHRTFTQVMGETPSFAPIGRFDFLRDKDVVWIRVVLKRGDKDVEATLPTIRSRGDFRSFMTQVRTTSPDELWLESRAFPGRRRGTDNGLRQLAHSVRGIGVAAILTTQGYRFYLSAAPPRSRIPYLAASYAIMFYLGSITRYRPHDFEKIITGRHQWLVEEFLASQPTQFIYGLAAELAGVDVVRPYAAVE